ncbi:PLP-dependent aminotransferase family protein [Sphingobacterium kitahiroshimense]|uniref:aminotransferase-like domain-containing protein n=1 Tax=Sphingobacterium kitahiroshimense TaxID=470446 RepID=UPI00320B588A
MAIVQFSLAPEANNNIIINDGAPDTTLLPYRSLTKEYRKVLDRVTVNTDLDSKIESPNLRASLRDFLNQTRGIDFGIENLFLTRGGQMALYLAAALILKPGDQVVVTAPCYIAAETLFEKLGCQIIRIPVDQYGMQTDILADVLENNDVKLLYIIPHHHHPTTVTMSKERREHILELIARYGPAVIEDDYDYDFQFNYDPYLPLASGEHGGNVIYIGSLTKVLGTPFRIGYMIASKNFLEAAAKLRVLIDIRGDMISEKAVAAMIDSGDLVRHIQKTNKVYAKRCDLLCTLLDKELKEYIHYQKPSGGLAIWITFKQEYELPKIARYAQDHGLSIKSNFYFTGRYAHLNAFRFGFASMNEAKLKTAVNVLKQAIVHLYPQ